MGNKYYTPSIEEFHVGFEYEERVNKDWIEKEFTFEWCGGNEILDIYNEGYETTDIRVKYLDKEDIESLGFEETYDDTEGNIWFAQGNGNIDICLSQYTKHNTEICNRITDQVLFKGVIKNKSELKRLLKQLGIDE